MLLDKLWPEGNDDESELKKEARANYQKAGARYLVYATALATFGFLGFYAVDISSGLRPWYGGVQTFRLATCSVFGAVSVFFLLRPKTAVEHYSMLMNAFTIGGLQAACYVTYTNHVSEPIINRLLWMDMSLVICLVVIFGFSRLSTTNTLLIVLSGVATAFLYLRSEFLPNLSEFMRVVIHLTIMTICLVLLRHAVERREFQLFVLAKENLQRNVYAKQLEAAKIAADLANEAKTRFLANMSHEIRTPMNGVLQTLEALTPSVPEAQRPLVDVARSSGRALLRILNGILDYSKLSAGKSVITLSAVDLSATVKTVGDLYSASALRKGLSLRTILRIPPSIPAIETDEVKLFEILNNVVSNAIKFTEQGTVEIAAECDQATASDRTLVRLTVTDSGIGISVAEIAGLGTPFFQVDNKTTKSHDGTGLGLAITKELVALLGGEIHVSSEPGAGTKVTLTFAARVMAAPDKSDFAPNAAPGYAPPSPARYLAAPTTVNLSSDPLRGGSVLLVEDNEVTAMLTRDLLIKLGYEVVTAKNGKAAVDICEVRRFDLILMDCQMPVMDGYEATLRLRAQEARRPDLTPTPIVAVTANTLAGDRERCLESGMNDYLAKPYSVRELRSVLQKWHVDQEIAQAPRVHNVVPIKG